MEDGPATITAIGLMCSDLKIREVNAPPQKQWRCTHGHRWGHVAELVGVQIGGELWGLAEGESLKFCALCIREKLTETLGQVREDT